MWSRCPHLHPWHHGRSCLLFPTRIQQGTLSCESILSTKVVYCLLLICGSGKAVILSIIFSKGKPLEIVYLFIFVFFSSLCAGIDSLFHFQGVNQHWGYFITKPVSNIYCITTLSKQKEAVGERQESWFPLHFTRLSECRYSINTKL